MSRRVKNKFAQYYFRGEETKIPQLAEVFSIRPSSNSSDVKVPLSLVSDTEELSYKVEKQLDYSFSDSSDKQVVLFTQSVSSVGVGKKVDFKNEQVFDTVTSFLEKHSFEPQLKILETRLKSDLPSNKFYRSMSIDEGVERLGLLVKINEAIDLDEQYSAIEAIKTEFLYNGTEFDGLPFFMQLEY
jgi:hypothetical protein